MRPYTAVTAVPRRGVNPNRLMVYASAGPELAWYDTNIAEATLTRRGSVKLPANVQYVWPHVSRRYLSK